MTGCQQTIGLSRSTFFLFHFVAVVVFNFVNLPLFGRPFRSGTSDRSPAIVATNGSRRCRWICSWNTFLYFHHFSFLPHDGFQILQELLLRTNHTSWPAYTHPCNDFWCCHSIMLHHVSANAGSRSSQPSLAVDGKSLSRWDRLKGLEDPLKNFHGRTGSIQIKLFQMRNSGPGKFLFVIVFLIESYYQSNLFPCKVGNII